MFWEKNRTVPKKPTILFCLVHQELFGHFSTIPIISEDFQRLPKIPEDFKRSEDYRNCPYTAKDIRRLEYCCALVEIRDYSPLWARAQSSEVIFHSDFPRAEKNWQNMGWPCLFPPCVAVIWSFFVLFAREMFETWTTVKNPFDTAKPDYESYENLESVCLSRL